MELLHVLFLFVCSSLVSLYAALSYNTHSDLVLLGFLTILRSGILWVWSAFLMHKALVQCFPTFFQSRHTYLESLPRRHTAFVSLISRIQGKQPKQVVEYSHRTTIEWPADHNMS